MRWLLTGGIVGLLCVAAGLYTLTARRPVVLAIRWVVLAAILASFVPGQVALLLGDPPVPLGDPVLWRVTVVVLVGVCLCWILVDRYVIFGATEEQLDAAMADALARLKEPFEKTSEGMRLTARGAVLKAGMGVQDVWNVSMSPRARRVLVAIAGGMRAYFASRDERGSRSSSYAWLVVGGVILLWQLFETILLRH